MSNILLNFRGLSLQNVLGRFFNCENIQERDAARLELERRGYTIWDGMIQKYTPPNRELS